MHMMMLLGSIVYNGMRIMLQQHCQIASTLTPLDRVERFSRNEKNRIPVARPNLFKVHNSAMGGFDLLDSAVDTYHTKIKGKKW